MAGLKGNVRIQKKRPNDAAISIKGVGDNGKEIQRRCSKVPHYQDFRTLIVGEA